MISAFATASFHRVVSSGLSASWFSRVVLEWFWDRFGRVLWTRKPRFWFDIPDFRWFSLVLELCVGITKSPRWDTARFKSIGHITEMEIVAWWRSCLQTLSNRRGMRYYTTQQWKYLLHGQLTVTCYEPLARLCYLRVQSNVWQRFFANVLLRHGMWECSRKL